MTDDEFWLHYEALRDNVAEAIHGYYTYKTIDEFAAESELHLRRMNEVAGFWIIAQQAFYSTFMVAIGRVSDTDLRSFSIHKLLDEVVACPERFSRSALVERKQHQRGFQEEWLDDLL